MVMSQAQVTREQTLCISHSHANRHWKRATLLTNGLAVFGLNGRHQWPGWPSLAAGAAVIGPVGCLWLGWPSLAWWPSLAGLAIFGLVAIFGRGGHLWPGWPSVAGVAIIGLEKQKQSVEN